MAIELMAGISLLKSALDVAKGLKDISDSAIRNAAVIELQEKILAAQAHQMALVERVSDLEKQMTRFETWEAEKQRYQLRPFGTGAVAYVLKRSEARGEPGHAICATCYEGGVKSILQSNGNPLAAKAAHVCPVCKTEIKTGWEEPPEFAD